MFGKISTGWRRLIFILILLGMGGLGLLIKIRQPVDTPVRRGYLLANKLGCFSCHGPDGVGGVPNPGGEEQTIPSWDGGTPMMYIEDEKEIYEWILYGSPKRLLKEGDTALTPRDKNGIVKMPAYEKHISTQELEDLVSYFKVVAEYSAPTAPLAQKGYDLANTLGCFSCHGQAGLTGSPNPKSFKGYIPPWTGADFKELVANDQELKSWIMEGTIERFEKNPLARFFTRRQAIKMPGYRDKLSETELEALLAYIHYLNKTENL